METRILVDTRPGSSTLDTSAGAGERHRRNIDGLAPLTDRIDAGLRQHAKADPRVKTLTTLPGAGQFTALVMLADMQATSTDEPLRRP